MADSEHAAIPLSLERRFEALTRTLDPADGLRVAWQALRFVYRLEDQ